MTGEKEKRSPQIHATADVSMHAKIGAGTRVWHQAQIREHAEIGENCVIAKNVYIDLKVKIGDGVKIQNNASIYYPAVIENDVFIGPSVTFTNDRYPRAFIWSESRHTPPIHVKRGASVGADSVIIGGVTIGEYAMIGAGSIVTRNVPPHALAFGNPARVRGFVCECGAKGEKKKEEKEFISFKCSSPDCGKQFKVSKTDFALLEKEEK